MLRIYVIFCLLAQLAIVGLAQNELKTLVFVDKDTQLSIPFVKLAHENSTQLSSIKGEIRLQTQGNTLLYISHPEYMSDTLLFSNQDTISLTPTYAGLKVFYTDTPSEQLLAKVIQNKHSNSPKTHASFKYKSYNKFYIATNKTTDTKLFLEKLLNPLSFTFKSFEEDHHLVISESITERIYKAELKEEEVVLSSKVSGIDRPLLLSLNSQVQSFSFYDDFIRISGKEYVSPLENKSLKRYNYQLIDKLKTPEGDSAFVVLFYPKKNKRFESLTGTLYINANNFALQYALMQPARESKTSIKIAHSAHYTPEGWFPEATVTTILLDNLGSNRTQFFAVAESYIYSLESKTFLGNKKFNDVAVYYSESELNDTTKLDTERLYPLTNKDAKTYAFYDSIGNVNNFVRAINLGERLYYKQIPYKYFNADLKHLIDVNDYVGVQIGIGASTNDKFSKLLSMGGYMEYGFKDKESKFGLNTTLTAPWKRQLKLKVALSKDISEAGGLPSFFQHKPMYNTEWLRKIRLDKFDKTVNFDIGFESNPVNYVFVRTGLKAEHVSPAYEYSFAADSLTTFNYTDLYLGIKIAYGERFFKLLRERISLGRPFPVLWVEFTRGLNGLNSDFEYKKLYSKVEYKHAFPAYGTTGIQLSVGKVWGNLPYGRLFNGKGSLGVRTVAHNSFETMVYNEFLSSQFFSLFLTHDFGYMNLLTYRNFRPRFELAMNIGFGSLNNPSEHHEMTFKTMEKGYFEIGGMANNLLVLNVSPVKMGLGIGFFHRIGAYRLPTFGDNTFIKLATTFKL